MLDFVLFALCWFGSNGGNVNCGFIMTKRNVIVAIIIILIGVGLYMFDPIKSALMPKCMFKVATGWSCPGCGLQRGVHALLHGHFVEALSYNYFFILSIPYAIGLCLERFFLPNKIALQWRRVLEHRYVIYSYIFIYCLWWVLRNVLGI